MDITPPAKALPFTHGLTAFRAAAASPDRVALTYFDASISYGALDAASDALASRLHRDGVRPGDRLALYMQNTPGFVIGLVAGWKLKAIPVPVNPMNRERELTMLFADCTPAAMLCQDTLYRDVVHAMPEKPAIIVTSSARDWQARNDPRLFPPASDTHMAMPGTTDLSTVAGVATSFAAHPEAPDDVAFIVYTSGTTGAPKGAVNTHRAAMHSANAMCSVLELHPGELILGLAPLFHIIGLVCQVLSAFALAAPLILSYRFEPGVMLDAIGEHRPSFAVGAITAYVAMMNHRDAKPSSFDPIRLVYSGGAPVPASVVDQFAARFGKLIRNGFGMTETNAPVITTPPDEPSRVDPASKVVSIGKAMPGLTITVLADDGSPAPPGQIGEFIFTSPSLTSGYWNKPEETKAALCADGFRSGDVGFVDADGWVFLIDRKKDMINASGYKVWPRDVEDVLYMHPAVREAAVVGIPDDYRGETVKAVVSLRSGHTVEPSELTAFCRERMAAYKYPHLVEIVEELPKTSTGKIMRRALRS